MAHTELNNDLVSHSPFDPKHLPADLMAGLVTFLVALPLCLGIAMASGASAITGVIAGIVAGVVVGWLSGAQVMVSGPAAGLVAVVASQIATLGSYEALLLAVVLAGLIQIALGLAQGGFIKSFVPTSVVRGLLSAIGVILILKQIPHLFGHDTDYEGEMSFFQPDRENTFSELLEVVGAADGASEELAVVRLEGSEAGGVEIRGGVGAGRCHGRARIAHFPRLSPHAAILRACPPWSVPSRPPRSISRSPWARPAPTACTRSHRGW